MLRTLGKLVRRLTEQAGPGCPRPRRAAGEAAPAPGRGPLANGRRCVLGIGLSLSDLAAMVGATAGVPGFNLSSQRQ